MFRKGAALLLAIVLSVAQPMMMLANGDIEQVQAPLPGPRTVQYINFSDDTNAWQSHFSPVAWPTGPFKQVVLTVTLHNKGDDYDRATAIGVNNVTLILMTTKEWVGGTQVYSRDVTVFQDLFNTPSSEVEWDPGLPSYKGGWTGNLTFAFYPGTPTIEIPKVQPAWYIRYVDRSMGNKTNATVIFPPGTQRATAVLSEEGFGNSDEFWFGNSAVKVRDFQCMINTTTVFDITGQPYVNSGGAIGGVMGDLYEWNATPPPGDGLRPLHMVNITPFSFLLNGTKNVTLAINEGQDFWWISLSFLLYGPADSVPFVYQNHVVQRNKISARELTIFTSAWSTRPAVNGQETLYVNYSSWLNSSSTVEVHEVLSVSRFIATATVYIVMEKVEDTVFNFTVDTANGKAVDVYYVQTWRNTTRVWGNGQNASRMDSYQEYEFIDGSSGGSRVRATHMVTRQDLGNLTHMEIQWNVTDIKYHNVTGSNGIGKYDPPASQHFETGTITPFPSLFFITPTPNEPVSGTVDIKFAYTNQTLKTASLDINGNPTDLTGKINLLWDTSSLSNGIIVLKTLGNDGQGLQHVNIIRVFKGQRPTVVTTDPVDKATLVPQDKAVSVKFSMPMAKTATEDAFSIQPTVNGSSFSWNMARDTLTWNHTARFKNDTTYNITVQGNATNSYNVEMQRTFAFSFKTWKPPYVTSVFPSNGSMNVTLNSSIRVSFSTPMNKTGVEKAFSILPAVGNGSFSWDGTGKTITWSHNDLFSRNQTYEVTIGADSPALDSGPVDCSYIFHLSTVNPPKVLVVSPINNTTRVRLDAPLTVNFTAAMETSTVETGFSITPPALGVFVWDQNSSSFSWQHATEFDPNTTYRVTIAAGVRDFGGIPMEEDYSWSFTTAPQPYVLSSEPKLNTREKNLDIFEPVLITFSEPMDTASVVDAFSIDPPVTGEFSWNGSQLTWTHPNEGFRPGSECTLTIETTAKSALGVSAASQFVLVFYPAQRPTIFSTTPVDGADSVPIDTEVVMSFSTYMNKTSVENALSIEPSGASSNFTIKWGGDANGVEFIPQTPLKPKTQYTFIIGAKATSKKNASLGADFRLTFRTGDAPDTTLPTIKSIHPDNGTLKVPNDNAIMVAFSEPMYKTSVEKAFTVTADNKPIKGSILWNPRGDTLIFTPSAYLPKGVKIEITIGRSASDLAGNNMTFDHEYWFQTSAKPQTTGGPLHPSLVSVFTLITVVAVALSVFLIMSRSLKKNAKAKKVKEPSKKKT